MTPFGKDDTAKEVQNHAAKTQDTWASAVENAEVAEIKQAVFRARNRLRAATTKEFDTKENIQFEHIDHGQVVETQQAASRACADEKKKELNARMNEGEMCDAVVPVLQTMRSRWRR